MTDFWAVFRHPWSAFFQSRTGRASDSAWAELGPRRIFILPTRAGLAYAGLLLVMLLGAINYNNNLLFGLTFLLTGLGLVTMLHCYNNLARLRLRAGQGRPGFVGEPLGFQIWIQPADQRPRHAIALKAADGGVAQGQVEATGSALWLLRTATRRGPLPLGMVTVSSRFPLGLFHTWSRVQFEHTELAYPAPAAPGTPPPTQPDAEAQLGDRGDGRDDFRGFRTYHPGDSLRLIYWKGYARGQGLLTKEFGSAQSHECWIDFALAPEPDPEARLRRLCRWILDAERAQIRYGLQLPGQHWPPGRGNAHRDQCLAALACFGTPP